MKELVLRDLNAPVDQEEMERLVERYIYVRKGVKVKISLANRLEDVFLLQRNLQLLDRAFNVAREWFKRNLDKISDRVSRDVG